MTVASGIRRRAPAMLASCLALMLAACDLFQPAPAPPPPPPLAPQASEHLPPPPRRKPRPPTAVARLVAPGGEGVRVGLDRLIGLDQPEVADMLGEPESRAEAPPATIWRYAGAGCEVDVYFYLDLQSQAMRALHYEVRSHDQSERSQQRCYDALRSERRAHGDDASGSDRPR